MNYSDKSKVIVIILAAGKATRLKPLSNRVSKPLIFIKNKPIICHIIDNFKEAGFSNFCFLVGDKANEIKKVIKKIPNIHSEYVYQQTPTGMGDAVLLCFDHITNNKADYTHLIVSAADTLIKPDVLSDIYDKMLSLRADIMLALMKSRDLRIANGHANVKLSLDDFYQIQCYNIIDIIEKPRSDQIMSDFYSLPLYGFKPSFKRYLENLDISIRGERELQDAIKLAIKENNSVIGLDVFKQEKTFEDIGNFHLTYMKDILSINFSNLHGEEQNRPLSKSICIYHPVHIDLSSKIEEQTLIGPNVILGKNCEVKSNCKLKNTIVYENAYIGENSSLNNCIVDQDVILPKYSRITDSFITLSDKNKIDTIKIYINF